jgi:hypothetical protein
MIDFTSEGFEIHIERKAFRNMSVTMSIGAEMGIVQKEIPDDSTITENNEFLHQEMLSLFSGKLTEVDRLNQLPKNEDILKKKPGLYLVNNPFILI